MTAEARENADAAAAMSQGEIAELKHMSDARSQHAVSGSAVAIEQPTTPDDVSISWPGSTAGNAKATLTPSDPRPVGQQRPPAG